MSVSIALFMTVFTNYIEQVAQYKFIQWNVTSITAADYTVEFPIKPLFYNKFLELVVQQR